MDALENLKDNVNVKVNILLLNKEKKEEAFNNISDIKLSIKLTESKVLNYKNEIKSLKQKKDNNQFSKQQKLKEIESTKNNIEKVSIDKEASENSIQELFKQEQNLGNYIKIKVEDKDKYMDNFYKEQTNIKTLSENINILEKARNGKELELSKMKLERENISSKLFDDYKLDIEEALLLDISFNDIKESKTGLNF